MQMDSFLKEIYVWDGTPYLMIISSPHLASGLKNPWEEMEEKDAMHLHVDIHE